MERGFIRQRRREAEDDNDHDTSHVSQLGSWEDIKYWQ